MFFSEQLMGYNTDIIRQTTFLITDPVMVGSHAYTSFIA